MGTRPRRCRVLECWVCTSPGESRRRSTGASGQPILRLSAFLPLFRDFEEAPKSPEEQSPARSGLVSSRQCRLSAHGRREQEQPEQQEQEAGMQPGARFQVLSSV